MFNFTKCKGWLTREARLLAKAGYSVTARETQTPATMTRRFTGEQTKGEIIVHDTGEVAMSLFDAKTRDALADEIALELEDNSFDEIGDFLLVAIEEA